MEWIQQLNTDELKDLKHLNKELIKTMTHRQCVEYSLFACDWILNIFKQKSSNETKIAKEIINLAKEQFYNPTEDNKTKCKFAADVGYTICNNYNYVCKNENIYFVITYVAANAAFAASHTEWIGLTSLNASYEAATYAATYTASIKNFSFFKQIIEHGIYIVDKQELLNKKLEMI